MMSAGSNSKSWLLLQSCSANSSQVTAGMPFPCVIANQFVLHCATSAVSVSFSNDRVNCVVVKAVFCLMTWVNCRFSIAGVRQTVSCCCKERVPCACGRLGLFGRCGLWGRWGRSGLSGQEIEWDEKLVWARFYLSLNKRINKIPLLCSPLWSLRTSRRGIHGPPWSITLR